MRDRAILHIDMNAFYASVAQHLDPSLRGKPVVVAGDPEKRSGIILAKSRQAKAAGVKTADAIWQAKQKCPDLIIVPPDYAAYKRYSKLARLLCYEYTNQVEPFGLDESWIDVTGSLRLFGGDPMLIAQESPSALRRSSGSRSPSASPGTRFSPSSAATPTQATASSRSQGTTTRISRGPCPPPR